MKKLLVLSLFLSGISVSAQETVDASGGEGQGSEGTVSYSVGQVMFSTYVSDSTEISEGVQKAYEIYVDEIPTTPTPNISLSVFPNPTTSNVTLQMENSDKDLEYYIYDLAGKNIGEGKLQNGENFIETNDLAASTYIITVIIDKNRIKLFKLVKQ